ncbi:hypothetical protein HPB50_001273 [Hyalomma asiaticum]|uniref:Uncharacterized protein n=1 Tax=Hyalomma asiaticum TaxID=266040 RepID=A0ACB7RRC7_HYAAI|nr:hypothetical protein HPB50_001273 [Hyalomma asiaticum]
MAAAFGMATPKKTYAAIGFSDVLDWRASNFLEPIPANRVCQARELVTRVTALLPCLHIFCKRCYEQCRSGDGHCCPFDGERVDVDDVDWREFPVENLLRRKVRIHDIHAYKPLV